MNERVRKRFSSSRKVLDSGTFDAETSHHLIACINGAPQSSSVCLVSQNFAFQKLLENVSHASREHCMNLSICVKGTELIEQTLQENLLHGDCDKALSQIYK